MFSVDSGATLLIGDLLDAADGVLDGSANCPVVTITNDVPDPTALAAVFADPNCFSFQEIFPGGFTPRFGGDVEDAALTVGLRGETAGGILWDASAAYGKNDVDFFINNTVNASLGPATPVNFDPGKEVQEEFNLNFDVSYAFGDGGNIAGGVEYRDEKFEIGLGQTESWSIGSLADQGFSAASNGFPGFSPIAAGNWSRSNVAAYADLEISPAEDWTVGLAARFEDFEDFGTTMNSKFATNFRINDSVAFRSSVSSGFRAPTPGQSNAFNVSTEFDLVLMDLVNNGNSPSISPVAALRCVLPLTAEKSINFTLGTILTLGDIDVTIDYFNIKLKDRLGQSQLFALTQAEIDALIMAGVTSAGNLANFRFFVNDFETRTQGIDLIANYSASLLGETDFTLAFNWTENKVTKFN
ncbi:MAG: TonB-dependent receptor, partial [Gammaproteobacteria bacterium]|nr:TonB-dependent receptor [Gammaproteobacteria bacterium]